MSGIVAAYGQVESGLCERMLARLTHRGPDHRGATSVGRSWLGARQLTVGVAGGSEQPVNTGTDGASLVLVGDGEIFGVDTSHAQPGPAGMPAVLASFADVGIDAFAALDGPFAVVVAAADGRFAAARDQLGIAPLYWASRDGTVLFASEMKAFDADWRPHVAPFPPGHVWTPRDGLATSRVFPEATQHLLASRSQEDPPDWVFAALRDTIVHAVERMLPANAPAGVLLSGGVDSSIVTAIAAGLEARRGRRLSTFAVGLAGSADLAAARTVAEHAGTDHHELVYAEREAIELVPAVIASLESFDPTLVHSAVPNYLVSRLAGEHAEVVLVGEGADELFAGYSHYGQYDTGEGLQRELQATLAGAHIGGLQRVDRVAAAHGVAARMPFLDRDVVNLAFALPPAWKLITADRPAKWLLRRAFDGWLPEHVLWRRKEQFGQGTGMDSVLRAHYEAAVSADDLASNATLLDPPVRTREELAYLKIFSATLDGIDASHAVSRFVEA